MEITLALSGGGFRATVYHLGVLARLAAENKLEDVRLLSTVSGGSLCVGLVYAQNNFTWPTSMQFLTHVEPQARRLLTSYDMQGSLILRTLGTIWTILETRASVLSSLMQKHWNLTCSVDDLPPSPRWMINTTCYETGKNWRIERFRMGDFVFGYTNDTRMPLSDALAASAGFPGLIGALKFPTAGRKWFRYRAVPEKEQALPGVDAEPAWQKEYFTPTPPTLHLWDGGVYDNHGLEGIFHIGEGWGEKFGFLLVSDAAGRAGWEDYLPGYHALMRLSSGIMMNQVRSLRTRAVLDRISHHPTEDQGVFLQMGHTNHDIVGQARQHGLPAEYLPDPLPDAQVARAAGFPTCIRRLTADEYACLFRHGYETADAFLSIYYPGMFQSIPYRAA